MVYDMNSILFGQGVLFAWCGMVKIVNGTIVADDAPNSSGETGAASSTGDMMSVATETIEIFGIKAPKWSLAAGLVFAFFVGGFPGVLIAGAVITMGYYSGQGSSGSSQVFLSIVHCAL